jgi:DNA-binding NarL/FixJ family response regulator
MNERYMRANVVLFGLSEALSADLETALGGIAGDIEATSLTPEECLESAKRNSANVFFCGPNAELVRELRRQCPNTVIIAASRIPDTDDWLDAIEAGADDYCAAPFETAQLTSMIASNLCPPRLAA